jgi:ferredoxin
MEKIEKLKREFAEEIAREIGYGKLSGEKPYETLNRVITYIRKVTGKDNQKQPEDKKELHHHFTNEGKCIRCGVDIEHCTEQCFQPEKQEEWKNIINSLITSANLGDKENISYWVSRLNDYREILLSERTFSTKELDAIRGYQREVFENYPWMSELDGRIKRKLDKLLKEEE